MCGDLRILEYLHSLTQVFNCLRILTHTVVSPTHAIEYGRVFRLRFVGALDVVVSFFDPIRAVHQGIAIGI